MNQPDSPGDTDPVRETLRIIEENYELFETLAASDLAVAEDAKRAMEWYEGNNESTRSSRDGP